MDDIVSIDMVPEGYWKWLQSPAAANFYKKQSARNFNEMVKLLAEKQELYNFIKHIAYLPIHDDKPHIADTCGCPIHQAQQFLTGTWKAPYNILEEE